MNWPAKPPLDSWSITEEADGTRKASGPVNLLILPEAESKIFMRNSIEWGANQNVHRRCLVGELDGVRVYVSGTDIVMTKRDIYPWRSKALRGGNG